MQTIFIAKQHTKITTEPFAMSSSDGGAIQKMNIFALFVYICKLACLP